MFLRSSNRKKDGKDHRYFSVVENQRVAANKTVQRTVLYLGEINDAQQAAWRKTLTVFDENKQDYRNMSLFPEDRELPADAVDGLQVRLSGLELKRARPFGNCWLASEIWRQLGLTEFWQSRLPEGREAVSWEKVLRLLVVNRLLEPGSEFRVHRHWFVESGMDALLETDFTVAAKDRLYRCLDRIVAHKQDLFVWLKQKWAELFQADFEVLLYDLTSTYFEGEMEECEKAKRGYSRDSRPDCLQVVIALIVTPDGFPLAYEVMDGNTSEQKTLQPFLERRRAGSTSMKRSGSISPGARYANRFRSSSIRTTTNSMCWRAVTDGKPRRSRSAASAWCGCCANSAPCGAAYLRAINCCCALERPRKKRAAPSASSSWCCRRPVRRSRVRRFIFVSTKPNCGKLSNATGTICCVPT